MNSFKTRNDFNPLKPHGGWLSAARRLFWNSCSLFQKNYIVHSSENTQKKDGGLDRPVSNNNFSSVTPNELATKARESIL